MLAANDISSVPADDVKTILIVLGFLLTLGVNAVALMRGDKSQKREISGSIETQTAKELAEQKDLDELRASVDALRAEITAQFNEAKRSGEARVAAITQNIDEEVRTLTNQIAQLAQALHEKINAEAVRVAGLSEAVVNLKSENFRQDAATAALQRQIEAMLSASRVKR